MIRAIENTTPRLGLMPSAARSYPGRPLRVVWSRPLGEPRSPRPSRRGADTAPLAQADMATGLLALIRSWRLRHQERRAFGRELIAMPEVTLADFGLTRREAEAEVAKPFWIA